MIEFLETQNPNKFVPMGFHNPHSYRGYYSELAFEPVEKVTVGKMLECAKEALRNTYEGWKGGDFTMNSYTDVYLAEEGSTGEEISEILLKYMVGAYD
ncbi:hypothetical protein [Hymenobacter mellowenesis]|uniref:hypothetical protein n=1 Tax=Hymenobacter mellowenesis TaxID=3063995 RepID=UPI00272D90F4|nr:hypothetical protein [Hymenobacter sp. M29]